MKITVKGRKLHKKHVPVSVGGWVVAVNPAKIMAEEVNQDNSFLSGD